MNCIIFQSNDNKPKPAPRSKLGPNNDSLDLPDLPDLPSVPFDSPTDPRGGVNGGGGGANINSNSRSNDDNDIDFDDLTRRFEELKKKK